MKYVSITEARQQLASLVEGSDRTMVMRNNKPVAAILSVHDYQALAAAQAREKDPKRLARLTRAHAEIQAGKPRATVDFSSGSAEKLLALATQALEEAESANETKALV